MGILALPQEILLDIFEASRPNNFENLALTCKQLYHAATPLLAQHNSFQKKYRNFKFGSATVETVPELLSKIAADPIIASYIVHANLGDRECPDIEDLPITFPDGVSPALAALVKQSEHLAVLSDDPEFSTSWLRKIVEHTDEWEKPFDFPVAFLLTLLTNVESLILPKEWCGPSVGNRRVGSVDELCRSGFDLVDLLISRANDVELRDQPLQKLHTLHPTHDVDTQSGTDMESIFPFLALDSLRELHHEYGVYEPTSEEINEGFCVQYPALGKHLEVVKLHDYVMSEHGASVFFKDMHRLRILEFQYSGKDEIGYDWDVDRFLWFMMGHIGSNLEKLSLTTGLAWPDKHVIESPLHGFEVLAHLELDTVLFVNSTGSTGNIIDVEEEEEEDDDDDDDEKEYDSDGNSYDDGKWRLVDMLPASLQTLTIYVPSTKRDCECLEQLFDGFDDRMEENLPRLKEVKVYMRVMDHWGYKLDDFQQYVDQATAYFSHKSFIQFSRALLA